MKCELDVYLHFPFCRAKCAYCALLSRAGSTPAQRANYVERLVCELRSELARLEAVPRSVYFGGGTPALCELAPIFAALREMGMGEGCEFTVELHPLDVNRDLLLKLREGGVNRISMGVQSLDDGALAAMGRGCTADDATRAFELVHGAFSNCGMDLIAGWPGVDDETWRRTVERALSLAPAHLSCYTLIHEAHTRLDLELRRGRLTLPDDAAALGQIDLARELLSVAGLERYEVSNYSRPGLECRHNQSVWRGEDYLGIGEGAHGRLARRRTVGERVEGWKAEEVGELEDALERSLLGLRTREGIDLEVVAARFPVLRGVLPAWRGELEALASAGVLERTGEARFAPTARGFEVCDAIMDQCYRQL